MISSVCLQLTLVLALLDRIALDLAAVVRVLHAGLELAVGKGTGEAGEELFGFFVGLWLACIGWIGQHGSCECLSRWVRGTVFIAVLLVLASGEVGSTASGELVGELWFVITAVDNLIVGLSLIGV